MSKLEENTSLVTALTEIEKKVGQAEIYRNNLKTILSDKGVDVSGIGKMQGLIKNIDLLPKLVESPKYLYNLGDEYSELTGGFNIVRRDRFTEFKKQTECLYFYIDSNAVEDKMVIVGTAKKIDVTDYTKIKIIYSSLHRENNSSGDTTFILSKDSSGSDVVASVNIISTKNSDTYCEAEINLENVIGEYYFVISNKIWIYSWLKVRVEKIYLEKVKQHR